MKKSLTVGCLGRFGIKQSFGVSFQVRRGIVLMSELAGDRAVLCVSVVRMWVYAEEDFIKLPVFISISK